jgi:hypothetical protein
MLRTTADDAHSNAIVLQLSANCLVDLAFNSTDFALLILSLQWTTHLVSCTVRCKAFYRVNCLSYPYRAMVKFPDRNCLLASNCLYMTQ